MRLGRLVAAGLVAGLVAGFVGALLRPRTVSTFGADLTGLAGGSADLTGAPTTVVVPDPAPLDDPDGQPPPGEPHYAAARAGEGVR